MGLPGWSQHRVLPPEKKQTNDEIRTVEHGLLGFRVLRFRFGVVGCLAAAYGAVPP